MRADNSRHVIAAAHRRAEQTRQRAVTALRRMDGTGQRITFDAVSRAAGVSRSWLYAQQDLRAEIQRLRQRHPATPPPQVSTAAARIGYLAATPPRGGHRRICQLEADRDAAKPLLWNLSAELSRSATPNQPAMEATATVTRDNQGASG